LGEGGGNCGKMAKEENEKNEGKIMKEELWKYYYCF
jgi:hypothetical protein